MAIHRKITLFCLLGSCILASCSLPKTAPAATSPLIVSTSTNVQQATLGQSFPELTETKVTVQSTPEIIPTKPNIYDDPNQVSDGNLKLSIKLMNEICYRPGMQIPIILTYENLTDTQLSIVDYNPISSHVLIRSIGQLFPVLTTPRNERLFAPEDFMSGDPWNPNSPLIQILPAHSKFDVSVEYYFPSEYMVDFRHSNQSQPIPDGQYFLKLVYIAHEYGDSWKGSISSNQIEICIVN